MKQLHLHPDKFHGVWSYVIKFRRKGANNVDNVIDYAALLYHSALNVVLELGWPDADALTVQRRIKEIADKVSDWPRRWEREQRLRQRPQVFWKINSEAVVGVQQISIAHSDELLPAALIAA